MTPPIEDSARKTFAAGLLFLFMAGAGWLLLRHSIALFSGNQMPGDPGPFFLSQLCLIILATVGFVLLVIGAWSWARDAQRHRHTGAIVAMLREWSLSAGFVLTLLTMPAAMRLLGTPAAVALFSIFWIYVLLVSISGHSWRNLIEAAAFGTATAAFIHLFFVRLLTLPLPV
ncbi:MULTISPECIES: tripartite tricarboxylate transporter TctB family protein [Alphaproteobacteria]|uniref:Tripartite tricarboxylate transporter TctB family protein n=1 Tax=Ponticoccus litoralis TaxID=422297 RepID=A0AAW9SMV0_9RHOB